MSGKVYGLGIGPGEPDLITVKALRILRAVPVIAFPAPEQGPSPARAIVAGFLPGHQVEVTIRLPQPCDQARETEVYQWAAANLGRYLRTGRDVAILCEGDPLFYGSFMYLFDRLLADYPVEVVPAVSALSAGGAAAVTPPALRNDILTVLPAPLEDAELTIRLTGADAVAIINVERHFERIRALLERLDLARRAHYVERAARQRQRVLELDQVDAAQVPALSMILVRKQSDTPARSTPA